MAQLSESLIKDTIRIIDNKRIIQLTIGEVRQLCFAWLQLNGHWKPGQPWDTASTQTSSPCAPEKL